MLLDWRARAAGCVADRHHARVIVGRMEDFPAWAEGIA